MNRCIFCGGMTHNQLVTFHYQDDDRLMLVEYVPAEVCERYEERTYSPQTTDALLHIANRNITPSKIIEVPVFDYIETR